MISSDASEIKAHALVTLCVMPLNVKESLYGQ